MQIKNRTLATAVALSTVAVSGAAGWGVAQAAPAHHLSQTGRTTLLAAYHGAGHAVGTPTGAVGLTVSLGMRNNAGFNRLMAALYNPHSPRYHHWLSSAAFNARFAPTATQRSAVTSYLHSQGLTTHAHGPFLVGVTGSAQHVATAFRTTLATIRTGSRSFTANTSPASVPTALASTVQGLVGLRDIGPHHGDYNITPHSAPRYGGAPYGVGLTPSQQVSLNNGNKLAAKGAKGQGKGETVAVFELSGYTPADIQAWWKQFYGSRTMPTIKDVNVDGGPVTPSCPAGDECGPFDFSGPEPVGLDSADYSGDVEVEADIEEVMAMAPAVKQIDVYNAPNDFNGTTELDEYTKIAQDNAAPIVSTSWGLCEYDAEGDSSTSPDYSVMQAEATPMMKMAAQGQSIFASAGDTGAFDCFRGSGYGGLSVDDPASDPWVTGVGGSSYESYDPGKAAKPTAPADQTGPWNVLGLCYPGQDTSGGCASFGATGGGDSNFWPAPSWAASLKGYSTAKYSSMKCGTSHNQLCNQVPAVSADADEFTPDAEECSGSGANVGGQTNPPGYPGDSTCAAFVGSNPPWFGIGGTSLATPLWAGVFALIEAKHGATTSDRLGLASHTLYKLAEATRNTSGLFFDVTGKHLSEHDNGYYPTTKAYDEATGLGTPQIDGLVTILK